MSCENPMVRVKITNSKTHKDAWRIYNMRKFCKGGYSSDISYKTNGIQPEPDHHGIAHKYKVSEQLWIEQQLKTNRAQLIPCGKCEACMKATARSWSARVENEAKSYTNKYFLTLTYAPENLPVLDINTGEIYRGYKDQFKAELDKWAKKLEYPERGTLWPDDVTGFLKRLRRNADYHYRSEKPTEEGQGIKYFYCGEYGGEYMRPHYHMILLGYEIPDIEFWKFEYDPTTGNKTEVFKSKTIDELWEKGIVSVQAVEQGSIGYVCGYCQKKGKYYAMKNDNGETEFKKYDKLFREAGLHPEFRRMSRGIGKQWALERAETLNEVSGGELANGHHMPVVRYYDKLLDAYHLEKEQMQNAEDAPRRAEILTVEETTEEETQDSMKSEYMKKVKERRRNNAFATQENERYNAYGNSGAKRLILEHIDKKAEIDRLQKKNQSKRTEKGDF